MRTPIRRNQDLWGGFIENIWNDSQNLKTNRNSLVTTPAVNIKNNVDHFEIELAAPGLKKEDFSIEVEDAILKLGVNTNQESEEQLENYTRKEFSYVRFQRNFTLPKNGVDVENINAQYENGILKISIPKVKEFKETIKKIAVQ